MQQDPFAVPSIPPMIKWLLIANGLGFLARMYAIEPTLIYGALWPLATPPGWPEFMPWQLLTYGFLHADLGHLFFNMFGLWMFGRIIEQVWGQRRFLFYYLVCIVGAAVTQLIVLALTAGGTPTPTVGASGAVFGILLAFGMMFPEARVMLLIPPIPMKAKWMVLGYGVITLMFGVTGTQGGVAHFAHLGGMVFGFGLIYYWKQQGRFMR
ncbi:MAG: rhomboid family intramembrane serine protease [Salinisphaeraceae bacterium]|jgi:membrane associated rhomboid family serine protease|nr:rhomboid family intramembrane serine protease [Salinisphaeraceae bacterium]